MVVLLLGIAAVGWSDSRVTGLPLEGEEALQFLRTARVAGKPKHFDALAITDPIQITLTDGSRTLRAIFKDEDTLHRKHTFADGRVLRSVKDSYKHEIAAFELDTLLGLGIVPPCVERKIASRTGALCLWVENAMTESERLHQNVRPPSPADWNDQMFTIRLLQQLIWDPDFNNVRNLLVDAEFKIYKIDSSMAFRPDAKLRREEGLTRFSRRALASLEALERSEFEARLTPWLDKKRLETLWIRRTRLLELANKAIAAANEESVLFD